MKRLADLAIPGTDRPLDLGDFLNALVAQGRISQDSADHLVTLRRAAVVTQTLVELVGMLVYIRLVPRLIPAKEAAGTDLPSAT